MKNKPTLIAIIVLLVIFVPLSIYTTYLKLFKVEELPDTKTQEGTSYLDDIDKFVDIKTDGQRTSIGTFKIANKDYTFVLKDNTVYLHSIADNLNILDYQAIKFYNSYIENNLLIVKRDNKWGIINLNSLQPVVKPEYDYLGLIDDEKDGVLNTNTFIGLKNNFYSLYKLGDSFKKVSSDFKDIIYTYNNNQKVIITINNDRYKVYDFNGNNLLENYEITKAAITNNYLAIIDSQNNLYLFNRVPGLPFENYSVKDVSKLKLKESANTLEIYLNDNLYKNIDI